MVVRRENDHLRLHLHAGLLIDRVAHVHHQVINLVGGGAAAVYHKAGVLLRDLGVADPVTLQAGLFNQGGGVMPFGAAEGAAGGGEIQRLLGPALFAELLHPGGDGFRVPLRQAQHRAENQAAARFLEDALPVAEPAVGIGQLVKPLIRDVEKDHAFHHVLQLPAIGPGVHDAAAAQRARDAAGKLQPREAVFLRKGGQPGQRHAGLGVYGAVRQEKELLQVLRADQEEVLQPLVGEKNVGAVAEKEGRDMVFLQDGAELRKGSDVLRIRDDPCGPADAEGGMGA